MSNATHDAAREQSPGRVNYISHRPPWADEISIDQDCISYWWTAPAEALDDVENGRPSRITVQLLQEDVLERDEQGISIKPGRQRIFLLDTYLDIENACTLVGALVACIDRYNVSQPAVVEEPGR